jgi:hypothetical protein
MSDEPERCECGASLAEHPPLPKPGPFKSWRQGRGTTPTSRPGPLVRRKPKET